MHCIRVEKKTGMNSKHVDWLCCEAERAGEGDYGQEVTHLLRTTQLPYILFLFFSFLSGHMPRIPLLYATWFDAC